GIALVGSELVAVGTGGDDVITFSPGPAAGQYVVSIRLAKAFLQTNCWPMASRCRLKAAGLRRIAASGHRLAGQRAATIEALHHHIRRTWRWRRRKLPAAQVPHPGAIDQHHVSHWNIHQITTIRTP